MVTDPNKTLRVLCRCRFDGRDYQLVSCYFLVLAAMGHTPFIAFMRQTRNRKDKNNGNSGIGGPFKAGVYLADLYISSNLAILVCCVM